MKRIVVSRHTLHRYNATLLVSSLMVATSRRVSFSPSFCWKARRLSGVSRSNDRSLMVKNLSMFSLRPLNACQAPRSRSRPWSIIFKCHRGHDRLHKDITHLQILYLSKHIFLAHVGIHWKILARRRGVSGHFERRQLVPGTDIVAEDAVHQC
jgi:hypothetical protein